MAEKSNHLEEIASRANALYSRPTVAIELVRLAEQPQVDAKRLKDCIMQDPALTCKVLRVVNSSLFGLHRPVVDLNQAIGILGIKSLKLLVLGFNLPDALFAGVAARELRWYWTNTLTRAVAARQLAEQLWKQSGDEAFIAGLLQDIGILVLLREPGEPYARFLTGVIEERCNLASLEQDTLGFDHIQLSAALLARWQMPERLVQAIEMPKRLARLARLESPDADLPQALHLADLLTQLVGQGRLSVLPELLEAGKIYRGMTKSKLATLVEYLQPQVDQLGQALSLELTEERDYKQTLIEAHRQMAALSEQIAGERGASESSDRMHAELLAHSQQLSGAMKEFLEGPTSEVERVDGGRVAKPNDTERWRRSSTAEPASSTSIATLARKLSVTAKQCREYREEMSLLILEPGLGDERESYDWQFAAQQARRALGIACSSLDPNHLTLIALSERRTAAILANCERRAALAVAKSAIAHYAKMFAPSAELSSGAASTLSVGVATASVVPKNFDPGRMIERAARCLSAARTCETSTVKSIEV